MHEFRMLGGIGLSSSDGREVDALLRQPKRVALLAYLAMPRPGTWHRRDTLLATFWPEHDSVRARTALRSALYTLRRHLTDGAIRTRGDDEVSLNPDMLRTDVAAMLDDIAAGRNAGAGERYAGELLPGLHIDEAEGFEKWLGQERSRLNGLARKAAMQLAGSCEKAGDLPGAIEAARRASELDPDDEASAQRWIALLDRSGDRSQAFAVYERFRKHVANEFGSRPSAETIALVDAVRTRRSANTPASIEMPPKIDAAPVIETPADDYEPTQLSEANSLIAVPLAAPAELAIHEGHPVPQSRTKWLWMASAIVLLAATAAWSALHGRASASSPVARSLVVLPAENETGDARLDYIGSGIAEGVARRLEGIGGLRIRSGARSDWPAAVRHDYKTIGQEFGSTVLLRTVIARVGDSLEVRAAVVDAQTAGETAITARRFASSQLRDVESTLAADVAGAVFRVPLPTVPRHPDRAADPESYRLTLEGWHKILSVRDEEAALVLFQRATAIDPLNARAWAGLSSAWALKFFLGVVPFDVSYDRSSAAAARALALDSLQSSAWGNLAILRALKYRSVAIGTELLRKAEAAEPGNAEIFLIKSTLYRHAHEWDKARDAIRVARALDPLSPVYAEREDFIELCADRPQIALQKYEADLASNPSDKPLQTGVVRSLVRLGRYDEAISFWRRQAGAGSPELAAALSQAHGASGYWAAKHVEGHARLVALEKKERQGPVGTLSAAQVHFLGGDTEGGFRTLENELRSRDSPLYHMPCAPGLDEVRQTPRFKAIEAQAGALPLR